MIATLIPASCFHVALPHVVSPLTLRTLKARWKTQNVYVFLGMSLLPSTQHNKNAIVLNKCLFSVIITLNTFRDTIGITLDNVQESAL